MNEPVFQEFLKHNISPFSNLNENANNDKTIYRINKEEENVEPLIVRRSRENLGFSIFSIICDKKFNYSNIMDFILNIIGTSKNHVQELTIDVLSNFNILKSGQKLNKNKVYLINLNDSAHVIDIFPEAFSLYIHKLVESTLGIIFISDNIDKIPQVALTYSQLVFLENKPENTNRIQDIFSKTCFYKLKASIIDNLDMICVDKLSLWTKIRNFSKY